MQTGQRIYKDCERCLGDGKLWDRDNYEYLSPGPVTTVPPVDGKEVDCPDCGGLGIIPWGWLRDEKEETMPGEEA
jgi:hypothetical protein